MKSLLRQLLAHPGRFAELLGATFFIHLLGLAGTLFVILVFNNYLPYGVNATLVTLAIGAVIASLAEAAFRTVRQRMAVALFALPLVNIAKGVYGALTRARQSALAHLSPARRHEALRGLDTLEQLASPATVGALLDAPFALIALVALFLISPWLCLIALIALALAWLTVVAGRPRLRRLAREIAESDASARALAATAIEQTDTVRAFNAQTRLGTAWEQVRGRWLQGRSASADASAATQTMTGTLSAWQGTAIIGVGALSATTGDLSAGALIGANILAARALAPMLRLASLAELFARAELAEQQISELLKLPREAESGAELREYVGSLELADLSLAYPGMAGPLFEHLSVRLPAGAALGVIGGNGSGKTTLARLICGLIEPNRGQVLIDGTDIRQMNPAWWRRQVSYLPQEPAFVEASVLDNLRMANPDLDDDRLNEIVRAAGLRGWLDNTPKGMETLLSEGGRTLAVGVRKRLALARALATGGRLAIFDEPTDALDDEGRLAAYAVMNTLRDQGVTLVVLTHDRHILRGVDWVLDLRVKPVPRLYPVPQSAAFASGEVGLPPVEADDGEDLEGKNASAD